MRESALSLFAVKNVLNRRGQQNIRHDDETLLFGTCQRDVQSRSAVNKSQFVLDLRCVQQSIINDRAIDFAALRLFNCFNERLCFLVPLLVPLPKIEKRRSDRVSLLGNSATYLDP